jgi:anti-sigma regulatory factor (Ser/Thr protein kinase)
VIIGGWRGPAWRVLDADPRRVSHTRRWIESAIRSHNGPVDADAAALIASELHTNALVHGPANGRVLVGYCLWREGARIAVADACGTATPRLVHGARLAMDGRGLHLVDSLAARWGTFSLPGAQVVWCDLGQRLRAPDSDAWAWLRQVLSVCPLAEAARPLTAQPCAAATSRGRGAGPGAPIAAHLSGAGYELGSALCGGQAAMGARAGSVLPASSPAGVR